MYNTHTVYVRAHIDYALLFRTRVEEKSVVGIARIKYLIITRRHVHNAITLQLYNVHVYNTVY